MARPHKEGLDYFPFDVDFFENKKIRRIMRGCGPGAATILTCLLCNIYQNKGYYILWDEDLPFDIADKIGMSEGAVSEVINKAIQVNFFNAYQFQKNKILTSEEIQKRYRSATLKRQEVIIEERFTVIDGNNEVIDYSNPIDGVDNEQSKVKYSKGKESKVLRASALKPEGAPAIDLKKTYTQLSASFDGKSRKELWITIKDFIDTNNPDFIEPYVDCWNLFAVNYKLAEVKSINSDRRKKFATRYGESAFDFLLVLEKISKSAHLKGENQRGWKVFFDWILENDKNYLKILEGNYD